MKQENEYHNNGGDTLHQGDTPQTSITEAKELITLEEAARFLGFKKSYLYKLTSTKQIPFYKYGGRVIAFDPVPSKPGAPPACSMFPPRRNKRPRPPHIAPQIP